MALACSPSLSAVELPLPPSKSLVLVFLPERGPPRARAFDFPSGSPEYVTLPSDQDGIYYALSYACGLAALGLAPGTVLSDPSGAPLPGALRATSAKISGGRAVERRAEPPVPTAIAALKLARRTPSACVSYEVSHFELGPTFQTAAFYGQDQIALALSDGISVRGLPGLELRRSLALDFAADPRGAVRDPEGGVYFVGADGAIDRLSADGLHSTLSSSTGTVANPIRSVRGAMPSSESLPLELYIATESGRFERWDGRAWQLLHDGAFQSAPPQADVAWLGPGHAIAVGVEQTELLEWNEGQLMRIPVALHSGALARILLHPSRGILLFTDDGHLITREGGFRDTPLAELGHRAVASAVPVGEGFLVGTHIGGTLFQYTGEGQACPPIVVGLHKLEQSVVFEGRVFVFGHGSDGASRVAVLTPLPEERCGDP